jgi:hypothetical protein
MMVCGTERHSSRQLLRVQAKLGKSVWLVAPSEEG